LNRIDFKGSIQAPQKIETYLFTEKKNNEKIIYHIRITCLAAAIATFNELGQPGRTY
jgi:acyl-CoA thioesterase FadM